MSTFFSIRHNDQTTTYVDVRRRTGTLTYVDVRRIVNRYEFWDQENDRLTAELNLEPVVLQDRPEPDDVPTNSTGSCFKRAISNNLFKLCVDIATLLTKHILHVGSIQANILFYMLDRSRQQSKPVDIKQIVDIKKCVDIKTIVDIKTLFHQKMC